MKFQKTLVAVAVAASLTGCAMTQNEKTAVGAGIGAVVGGVLGHQVNGKNGRYVGAVLGALAGGAIGRYMNQQQKALENALASSGITVTRVDDATIKLNLPESITFAVNKANLNSAVKPALSQIAQVLNEYPKTAIHVLGFTDSSGAADYNMKLSQRRAKSAAGYLASQGVVQGRMAVRGYGEGYPIASNDNASGRGQNRRAEIYIRAIEKGNEQGAYSPIY
ncbi:MAG: OmpA family protein [Gammaproteobacteria bacterium]|nr:OmpA family protein [Gammaproteobacteria bacterium]